MNNSREKSIRNLNGYRVIYKPDHPSAMTSDNWKGYVYEHIYIIERHLERQLTKDEIVHHLDCNRANNRLDNLLVLSRNMHNKLHEWINNGAVIHESYEQNRMNSGNSKVIEPEYCEICGLTLYAKQKHTCSVECYKALLEQQSEARRGKPKPTLGELRKDMKELSWLAIGRKYNVSDNGARKWAKQYGLL